jgi:hypothetical protein
MVRDRDPQIIAFLHIFELSLVSGVSGANTRAEGAPRTSRASIMWHSWGQEHIPLLFCSQNVGRDI